MQESILDINNTFNHPENLKTIFQVSYSTQPEVRIRRNTWGSVFEGIQYVVSS